MLNKLAYEIGYRAMVKEAADTPTTMPTPISSRNVSSGGMSGIELLQRTGGMARSLAGASMPGQLKGGLDKLLALSRPSQRWRVTSRNNGEPSYSINVPTTPTQTVEALRSGNFMRPVPLNTNLHYPIINK